MRILFALLLTCAAARAGEPDPCDLYPLLERMASCAKPFAICDSGYNLLPSFGNGMSMATTKYEAMEAASVRIQGEATIAKARCLASKTQAR